MPRMFIVVAAIAIFGGVVLEVVDVRKGVLFEGFMSGAFDMLGKDERTAPFRK